MPLKVALYQIQYHHRSEVVCRALERGIRRSGDTVLHKYESDYKGVEADVAVFYGLEGNLPKIFKDYKESAKAFYVDLGYWGRRQGGRWKGYHKIAVNSRHPDIYFQSKQHSNDRAAVFNLNVAPWRHRDDDGKGHVVLAGMGDKGAAAEGFKPEEWERWAMRKIKLHTKRPIIYRAKPSWKTARPIGGMGWSPRTEEIEKVLKGAWAVVTHHSNVAVDGLMAGIPCFVWNGVAKCMGLQDLGYIESPFYPDNRQQWVNDIAYCQWSIDEMREGVAWRDLKAEGLL